jgi:hypothetical protein
MVSKTSCSLMLAVAVVAGGCAQREAERRAAQAMTSVESFFKNSVTPRSSSCDWGLERRTVFETSGFTCTGIEVKRISDQPEEYRAKIDFWCRGEKATGERVGERRTLEIRFRLSANERDIDPLECRFVSVQPLTFTRQATTWLCWSLAMPIVAFFFILNFVSYDWELTVKCVPWVTILGVAYVGYVCFGSGFAAVGCTLLYLVVNAILLRMVSELA